MSVRRIKGKQMGRWCDWCPPKTTRAIWRGFVWGRCACQSHLADLRKWDRIEQSPDCSDAAFVGGF